MKSAQVEVKNRLTILSLITGMLLTLASGTVQAAKVEEFKLWKRDEAKKQVLLGRFDKEKDKDLVSLGKSKDEFEKFVTASSGEPIKFAQALLRAAQENKGNKFKKFRENITKWTKDLDSKKWGEHFDKDGNKESNEAGLKRLIEAILKTKDTLTDEELKKLAEALEKTDSEEKEFDFLKATFSKDILAALDLDKTEDKKDKPVDDKSKEEIEKLKKELADKEEARKKEIDALKKLLEAKTNPTPVPGIPGVGEQPRTDAAALEACLAKKFNDAMKDLIKGAEDVIGKLANKKNNNEDKNDPFAALDSKTPPTATPPTVPPSSSTPVASNDREKNDDSGNAFKNPPPAPQQPQPGIPATPDLPTLAQIGRPTAERVSVTESLNAAGASARSAISRSKNFNPSEDDFQRIQIMMGNPNIMNNPQARAMLKAQLTFLKNNAKAIEKRLSSAHSNLEDQIAAATSKLEAMKSGAKLSKQTQAELAQLKANVEQTNQIVQQRQKLCDQAQQAGNEQAEALCTNAAALNQEKVKRESLYNQANLAAQQELEESNGEIKAAAVLVQNLQKQKSQLEEEQDRQKSESSTANSLLTSLDVPQTTVGPQTRNIGGQRPSGSTARRPSTPVRGATPNSVAKGTSDDTMRKPLGKGATL